jgi:hypothetical protein
MSRAKAKGTAAETAVVKFLQGKGFPGAERRALGGGSGGDLGDITGTPCLTWEVKAQRKYAIPAWLKESAAERENSSADYCPLIVKPVGVGSTRVGDWWAILPMAEMVHLLREAGYGDPL